MSTKDILIKLNTKYCNQLKSKPLTTKAITLVFFALLNEQLASFFAGDIRKLKFRLRPTNLNVTLFHTLTTRVPLMGLFALLINAPLTHYGYKIIQRLIPSPLTPRKKFLQICLSTGILTPIFCACFVSWIGFINNLSAIKNKFQNDSNSFLIRLKNSLKFISTIIISSLKSNFVKVASTSIITSPIFMILAQKFVIPEAWTVFFAFCYFIVGTYNNTKVKLAQKRKRELENKQESDLQQSSSGKKIV